MGLWATYMGVYLKQLHLLDLIQACSRVTELRKWFAAYHYFLYTAFHGKKHRGFKLEFCLIKELH